MSAKRQRAKFLMEMASMLIAEEAIGRPCIMEIPGGNESIAEMFRPQFGDYQTELFVAIYMDQAGKLLGIKRFAEGSRTRTVLYPRLLFKAGFELDATMMILAHNHPGGSLLPSQQDRELTRRIQTMGESLELNLRDHFILNAAGEWASFKDKGWM